jgi:hypothetical protein
VHLPETIVSAPCTPMHLIDSLGSEELVLTVVLEYDSNLWYFRIPVLRAVNPLRLSNLILLTKLQFGPSHHHYDCAFSVANPHGQRKSPRPKIDWKDMSIRLLIDIPVVLSMTRIVSLDQQISRSCLQSPYFQSLHDPIPLHL